MSASKARPTTTGEHTALPLLAIGREVVACRKCPRLVRYREEIARVKKPAFADWTYWGRPVPGFGDPEATLLIVGLAPAAHGGNRTGRVFTGDKSGDFLFKCLCKAGYSNQALSQNDTDGLRLNHLYLTAAVKCAPPENEPTLREAANCSSYLQRELKALKSLKAILCLGQFAYDAVISTLKTVYSITSPKQNFKHGLEVKLKGSPARIFASYHPSPRNTQTGKLTEKKLLSILWKIRRKSS